MLVHNWRTILRRAWSIRVGIYASLFTGLIMGLPALMEIVPPFWFISLCVIVNIIAYVLARITKQKNLDV